MFVATFAIAGLSFTKPRSHRVFHYITAAITMVAGIAYFTMGADLGETGIPVEFARSNSKVAGHLREIFYVRYIDWYETLSRMQNALCLHRQGDHHTSVAYGSPLDRRSSVAHYPLHYLD